jgi:hypothetical protein
VIAVGVLLAGCGGGGGNDNGSTGGGDNSKATYIAHADQICAHTTFLVSEAGRARFGNTNPTREQVLQFATDVFVPAFDQLITNLRALHPPPGDEAKTAAIYDSLEQAVNRIKQDPNVYLEPNQAGIFDRPDRLARAYGFTQCGQK